MVLSLLVLKLGPGAVGVVQHHALTALLVVGVLAVMGFGWWWLRKRERRDARLAAYRCQLENAGLRSRLAR